MKGAWKHTVASSEQWSRKATLAQRLGGDVDTLGENCEVEQREVKVLR